MNAIRSIAHNWTIDKLSTKLYIINFCNRPENVFETRLYNVDNVFVRTNQNENGVCNE